MVGGPDSDATACHLRMSDLKIREGHFNFQGLNLSYKEWMQVESGPTSVPVIALHGWMDNAGSFDELIPRLDCPHVIALDFSGHGLSDHRSDDADYYIWSWVEEVLALLQHLNIERCYVLAHSMGGAVASLFTALHPDKVIAQVHLDMVGPITTPSSELLQQMRTAIENNQAIDAQSVRHYPSIEAARQSRANRGISLAAATSLGHRGIASDKDGWYWSVDRQLTRRHLLSLSEEQCEIVLRGNTCPTLVVTAVQTWAHRREFIDRRLTFYPRVEYKEFDGSHFQHLEGHCDQVASAVNQFLARQ